MATDLRVAGFQMGITRDIPQHVATLCGAIERAATDGADILVTPEGSLSGYTPHFDVEQTVAGLATVTRHAAERGLALALGTCFREDDGLVYNQLRFYDSDGTYLGFHSKILRCATMTEPPRGELNDYATTPLRTFTIKGVTVGALICNDLWANPGCTPMPDPHLTHQLAQLGAKVIFHGVNGGRDGGAWSREVVWPFHEMNLRMRAVADRLWIVTVDNSFPFTQPCSAPSGVVAPLGHWACQAPPQGEYLFFHTITVDD